MIDSEVSKAEGWRELCAAASEEPDSEKLMSLINQILQALEELDQPSKLPTSIGCRGVESRSFRSRRSPPLNAAH